MNKFLAFLLVSIFILVSVNNVYAAPPNKTSSASSSDLDVTYIERTPRYNKYCVVYENDLPKLCAGTENDKRWPDIGENVKYIAHVINKGNSTISKSFSYSFLVNGNVVKTGSYRAKLGEGQEITFSYDTTWASTPKVVEFKVDTTNSINETAESNNRLSVGSHDLTISIWIEKGMYDIFNQTQNLTGTYSFEDWIQKQFSQMNERFAQAQYATASAGIIDRVKIDKIVVADELDGPSSLLNNDPDKNLIDGRWQFVDNDPTNATGQNGSWRSYIEAYANKIDWGLIHELAHQLGIIDLYRMNLANDPENNSRVLVTGLDGSVIDDKILIPVFKNPGLMAGGNTSPYNDKTYFESHTALGMNSHKGLRRGFFGEYLFDTPTQNYIKIVDALGNPIASASASLYQKDPSSEVIDNTPEITGITDSNGILYLPNRVAPFVTTVTGHTLKDNPFGKINVVGTNGTMLIKVTVGSKEDYRWLTIHDLNLAYWLGNKESATYTIQTSLDFRNFDPVNQALGKQATSNRESLSGHEPSKAVDGDTTTFGNSWQVGNPVNPGDWWQVNLGAVLGIGKVRVYPNAQNYSDFCKQFHVEVSKTGAFAGEQLTVVTEDNRPHFQYNEYFFPATQAQYIRVVCDNQQNWVQLQEFEVYKVLD